MEKNTLLQSCMCLNTLQEVRKRGESQIFISKSRTAVVGHVERYSQLAEMEPHLFSVPASSTITCVMAPCGDCEGYGLLMAGCDKSPSSDGRA